MTRPVTFDFTARTLKVAAERTRAEIDRLNNPHEFRVESRRSSYDGMVRYMVINEEGEWIGYRYYPTQDAADDAIGAMIADDDADRRLNRHRHESGGD